jgi:hypothetical protein
MNKKIASKIASQNIYFLILLILTITFFMKDVNQAFYTPNDIGELSINSVGYNLLNLKIDVVERGQHTLHTIYNYPLIPIVIGIIYNIYNLLYINKNKQE